MAEIALPMIVTAIASSELEGFVAATLFSQGWNVIFRALDVTALTVFLDSDLKQSQNVVLVFSPDLPGISPNIIASLKSKVRQIIGFSNENCSDQDFAGLFRAPNEPAELLNLVRGFVRAPLMRNPDVVAPKRRRAGRSRVGQNLFREARDPVVLQVGRGLVVSRAYARLRFPRGSRAAGSG